MPVICCSYLWTPRRYITECKEQRYNKWHMVTTRQFIWKLVVDTFQKGSKGLHLVPANCPVLSNTSQLTITCLPSCSIL
jgi:hypothetical protein